MSYDVRGSIFGFMDTTAIDIVKIDDLFSTMVDKGNNNISFTIVNPYLLREYSFDIPTYIKVILYITYNYNLSFYNILIIKKPL